MATTSALAEPSGWCPSYSYPEPGMALGQPPWLPPPSHAGEQRGGQPQPLTRTRSRPGCGPVGWRATPTLTGEASRLHGVRLPCLRTNWRLRDMLRSRECSTPGCRCFARSAPRPWGGRARPSGVFLLRCLSGGLVRVPSGRGWSSSTRSLCFLGIRMPGL